MQSENSDDELLSDTLLAIVILSHALLSHESIEAAITTCKKVKN